MFGFKRRRRRRLKDQPFPFEWAAILERNVPCYRALSPSEQSKLQGHIQVFLDEKRFEGCAGLEITDEIRVTIAAQACMLLLHRQSDYYPRMQTIFVYPHRYPARSVGMDASGIVTEANGPRLGESWYRGPVVLSWDDARKGAADARDGHNIVFHEFAHQLDSETGEHDGAPVLPRRSMYIAWARALGHDYRRLIDDIARDRKTVLDAYGASDAAEFFAVATEAFFEKPHQMRKHTPELYEDCLLYTSPSPRDRS